LVEPSFVSAYFKKTATNGVQLGEFEHLEQLWDWPLYKVEDDKEACPQATWQLFFNLNGLETR